MTVTSGTKLGPYEIQSALGAGGMGEVYRARDTRLGRDVAIKVLPQHLSSNPELKERFEREARAISSLNHARICTLYDVGHQDGIDFLVMEYLEGDSLAARLKRCAPPERVGEAWDGDLRSAGNGSPSGGHSPGFETGQHHADQIRREAHRFWAGKAMTAGTSSGGAQAPLLSAARTMSGASPLSPLTTAGAVIGTIQYMSPEQIEGKDADARSDLFALGAVLYEMTTGNRPFDGKSQISVASSILEKNPEPISALQPLTPLPFERIVDACLAKNPDDRIQTAHDIKLQLKWIADAAPHIPSIAEPKRKSHEWIAWLAAAALAATLVAFVVWWRSSRVPEQITYFSAPLPFAARDVAVAPNGHTVALVGYRESERKNTLWTYEPGSQDATSLLHTEGANYPFWSPDGRSLGFFADGKLKKLDISGGTVQTLCDAPTGRGGTWNKDGVILFTPSGMLGTGVYRIPAAGGTPTPVTTPDRAQGEDSHRWPVFLPDGIHYLFLAVNLSGRKELYTVFVGSLNSNEKRLVTRARANAAYAAPGFLLFYRDQTLFAQHFDSKKFELSGEPTPILNDVQYLPRIAKAVFAATDAGLLVAQKSGETGVSQLLWFDRKGQQVGAATKLGATALYGNVFLAPNGKSLAADTTDATSQNTDIWTYDLQNGSRNGLRSIPRLIPCRFGIQIPLSWCSPLIAISSSSCI